MPGHPRIFVDHPLASKTEVEVRVMAERSVDAIAKALTELPEAA